MSERPTVALVITHLAVGGATVTVQHLCEALSDQFDMRVVCGSDTAGEGTMHDAIAAAAPVTLVPELHRAISPVRDVRAVAALRRALRAMRPALVHTHSSKAGIIGRAAAAPTGARVVHTIHGWGHTPQDPRLRRGVFVGLERLAALRTDALVAVSTDVREDGLRDGIGRPEQYEVIPPGVEFPPRAVDFAGARAEARRKLGLADGDPVIGWVGRFAAQKDPVCLGETLVAALGARPDARAVLVGEGPDRGQVEQRLAAAGVAERALFTGVRSDVPSLYPAFDVIVHVSRWEGQPRVIQEALAARVPVVATRASGVRDLVVDGRTGYVLEPGDAAGVADRTLRVLERNGLMTPLPDDAVDAVRRTNDVGLSLDRHRRLYTRLLEGAAHAG